MSKIEIKAYAKINLSLDVTGVRDNGYHDVSMVMQSVGLFDEVTIERCSEDRIFCSTDNPALPNDERNLAYRAAALLKERFSLKAGVAINIRKKIPMEAGLAGGSTDCGAVITGMNRLFELGMTAGEMRELGVKLGADVPFCIEGGTMLSEGIGEILTPIKSMVDCGILIVKPSYGVNTKEAYGLIDEQGLFAKRYTPKMIRAVEEGNLKRIAGALGNAFEDVIFPRHEDLMRVKESLIKAGALGGVLSGSGPSIFGIFESLEEAEAAKLRVKAEFSDMMATVTTPVAGQGGEL